MIKKPRMINKRAFTFIEMVMVVSFVAVISISVSQALINGLEIWKSNQNILLEEDIAIFLEKITRDVRNSLSYSLIPFEGDQEHIIIPTSVRVRKDKKLTYEKNERVDQLGRVEYSFDKLRNRVLRRVSNYGQAIKGDFSEPQILAQPVKMLRFRYLTTTDGKAGIRDKAEGVFPVAIKIELIYVEKYGKTRMVERLIRIPVININNS